MEYSIIDFCLMNDNLSLTPVKEKEFLLRVKLYHSEAFEKSRVRAYVDKRRAIFFILHKNYGVSLTRIGQIFNQNHATVLHSIRGHHHFLKTDKNYQTIFKEIKDLI